jgi:hypothetical protein
MNRLFSFLKFLIDDLKSDVTTIKRIVTDPAFFKDRWTAIVESLRKVSSRDWFESILLCIILLGAGVSAGWFLASRHYEGLCNQFIVDNYHQVISNVTYNLSAMFQ